MRRRYPGTLDGRRHRPAFINAAPRLDDDSTVKADGLRCTTRRPV
jgi:hypothetical protein